MLLILLEIAKHIGDARRREAPARMNIASGGGARSALPPRAFRQSIRSGRYSQRTWVGRYGRATRPRGVSATVHNVARWVLAQLWTLRRVLHGAQTMMNMRERRAARSADRRSRTSCHGRWGTWPALSAAVPQYTVITNGLTEGKLYGGRQLPGDKEGHGRSGRGRGGDRDRDY